MRDIERLRIGTILLLFDAQAKMNEQAKAEAETRNRKGRKATQADIDAFALR